MASAITLDHSKIFSYEATIPEIFGQDAKPGRELLETIISTYKATRLQSVSQCTVHVWGVLKPQAAKYVCWKILGIAV